MLLNAPNTRQKCPFPRGSPLVWAKENAIKLASHLIAFPWAHSSPHLQPGPLQFSRFSSACRRDKHKETQTTFHPDACSNSPHIAQPQCFHCWRCGLKIFSEYLKYKPALVPLVHAKAYVGHFVSAWRWAFFGTVVSGVKGCSCSRSQQARGCKTASPKYFMTNE